MTVHSIAAPRVRSDAGPERRRVECTVTGTSCLDPTDRRYQRSFKTLAALGFMLAPSSVLRLAASLELYLIWLLGALWGPVPVRERERRASQRKQGPPPQLPLLRRAP